MGSINPIVVTDAALAARAEAIADGLVASVSNFGGQLCTKPGVVFVPAGEAGDAFARDVAARLDGVEPTVLLNERLRDALGAAVERLAARPEVRRLGGAPAFAGDGFRHQPAATRRPRRRSPARRRRCSRSTSARSCCCCATASRDELLAALQRIEGQLTGSIHAQPDADAELLGLLTELLAARAGRVVYDGFPTGVAVTHGMHHGGPYPATSAPAHTSVGMTAIRRFLRPVAWQNAPAAVAAAGAARREPARDLAPRRRRADARSASLLNGHGQRNAPHEHRHGPPPAAPRVPRLPRPGVVALPGTSPRREPRAPPGTR